MRLGQFARKYDIPVQEIIEYLEGEVGEKFHPNAKLYDVIEAKVFNHFEIMPTSTPLEKEPDIEEENLVEELVVEETPEDDIAAVEGELADMDEYPEEKPINEKVDEAKPRHAEDEVIQTDKLLEMLESGNAPTDLDKIKLIKAAKRELSGLKVLGKVDLPEPKKKEEQKEAESRGLDQQKRRPQLSEEEKERRRLKAKRKKEAFEARQEKRRKEQEARQLKELKAQHYKQKLQKVEVVKHKQVIKDDPQPNREIPKNPRPEPKTWFGKWWRWMNT